MINEQWLKRWQDNNIGFHRTDVNPVLEMEWPKLNIPSGSTVYVPLCGKTVDMAWLAAQGYNVVGVELSDIAVIDFFESHKIPYTVTKHNQYAAYQSEAITIYAGDLFELPESLFANIDAIYDRAAFIAMAPEQREPYAERFFAIAEQNPDLRILLITVQHNGDKKLGPPYYITQDTLEKHFGSIFAINRLDSAYKENLVGKRYDKAGVTDASGVGYRLQVK